jgi:hypothetical protein
LPPELKAYDFGEAYYIEDGGVVISPYAAGFYCPDGTSTPEGIRVMPGQGFVQIDSSRKVEQVFKLIRLNEDGSRAFFREHVYTYETSVDQSGRTIRHRMRFLSTDDFYLTRFRGMEPFDHVFTNIELNPGARVWAVSKN